MLKLYKNVALKPNAINIGLIAELAVKCFHKGQNIIKTSVRRISDFIQDPELETRMPSANDDAENLYEVVRAASGLAVRTAAYAPG